MNRYAYASLCVAILSACANPYEQFYRGIPDGRKVNNYVPPTEPVQVYSSSNFANDIAALQRRGYAAIGQSSFNGAANRISESQLREEANKLGAAMVLVASRYTGTVSGVMPLMVPHNSTSYTTGNATVTGPEGVANVTGTATTNTYGTSTVMMPYNIQRADFAAVYFVKTRPHLGVFYGVIDDATRARLQTNAGALIKVIVEGSPAARADILPGDIVLAVDDVRVDGPEDLNAKVAQRLGQQAVFDIDRNGQRLKKTLTPAP